VLSVSVIVSTVQNSIEHVLHTLRLHQAVNFSNTSEGFQGGRDMRFQNVHSRSFGVLLLLSHM